MIELIFAAGLALWRTEHRALNAAPRGQFYLDFQLFGFDFVLRFSIN